MQSVVRRSAICLAAICCFATVAVGDSVDYQGAGTLANHTAFQKGQPAAGHTWEVGDQLREIIDLTTGHAMHGNLGILDVTTGSLSSCMGGEVLCFSGGSLDIDNRQGKDIFFGMLKNGTVINNGTNVFLNATLRNGATTVFRIKGNRFSSQALITPAPVVAEPATLIMFSTGLALLGLFYRAKRGRV